jgi:hypothetical protein
MATPWETLGATLGGGIDREGAYEKGRLHTAQTESALGMARQRQLENTALEEKAKERAGIEESLVKSGMPAAQAQMMARVMKGELGSEYANATQGALRQQEFELRDVLSDPTAPAATQLEAAQGVQGKLQPRYHVDGNVSQDLLGEELGLTATPVGESVIGANQALTNLRTVQAGDPDYRTATGGGGGGGGLGSTPAGMVRNPAYDSSKPPGEGNYPFLNGVQPQMLGREAGFFNRIYGSAGAVSQDTFNLSKFPFRTTSVGVLGIGKSAGPDVSVLDAVAGNLKYTIADEDVRNYNVILSGMNRALSFIEGQGLQGSNTLAASYDALAIRPGDTIENVMFKMAQTRQTVEQGLRPHLTSPRVPVEQKEDLQAILRDLAQAVPFTVEDVIALRIAQQAGRSGASIGELAAARMGNAAPAPRPAPGGTTPAPGAPVAPRPAAPAAPAMEFASVEEAEAAEAAGRLEKGTRVTIGGQPGTWQ